MGVLESRVLDFDTVIVTSMNESFLPEISEFVYSVWCETRIRFAYIQRERRHLHLSFYHLLQRAKNIYLLYNTESEGLDAGEKSRFITQLEVAGKAYHNTRNL
jgi:inactivated superfamily I helicase